MSVRIARLFASGHVQIAGVHMPMQVCTAEERISRVRACDDAEQLREALTVYGLQVTVRRAIERKLTRITKEST